MITQASSEALSDNATVATEKAAVATEANASSEEPHILYELTEKRDEITKHFAMSDGSTKAYIYPQHVHYLEDEKYEEIDNTLLEHAENGKNYYKNKKNDFSVKIPESFTDDYIEFSDDKGYVKFKLLGSTNKKLEKITKSKSSKNDDITIVKNANDKAIFKSVKGNIDIEYDLAGNKLKETIILYKKTKNSFIFDIQTSASNAIKNNDNSISFYDAGGTELYTMESPYMIDAAGEYSNNVVTTLTETASGYTLTYQPDYEWLSSKDREYPVKIDPTLVQAIEKSDVTDTYVSNMQSASNPDVRGAWDVINIGRRTQSAGASQKTLRGLIKFNLPSQIGANDCIVDAKLHLTHYTGGGTSNNGAQIDLHELNAPFDAATTWWGIQPSYEPIISDYTIVNTNNILPGTSFTYDSYNITKLVDKWHNGATNHGIILKLHDDTSNVSTNQQVFYFATQSRYYGSIAKFVEITYRNSTGLEDYWNYTTQDFGQYGTGYVNNYNGNLVYVHEDTSFNSLINGFTLAHVYNSCNEAQTHSVNNEMGHYGAGWHLNLFQKFESVTVDGNSSVKFKYTDGDGTEHYFIETSDGKIVDEDGLGYTYQNISEADLVNQITDKNGTTLKFDRFKYLRRIIDQNGNTISLEYLVIPNVDNYLEHITTSSGTWYSLTYDSNYNLSTIIDNAHRTTTFRYDSGNLSEIEYPDGTITKFEYQSGTHLLQKVSTPSGKKHCYGYESATKKVSLVEFQDINGNVGERKTFDYKYNQTKITDIDGKYYTYQFDTFGRVTGVYDWNNNVCTQKFTQHSTTSSDVFRNNKISSTSNVGTYINNLVNNGCFYRGDYAWTKTAGNEYYSIDTNHGFIAPNSMKITGNESAAVEIRSYPSSIAGKTYTLSAYFKYENVSGTANYGAGIEIYTTFNRKSNTFVQGSSDSDVDNGYRRLTTTITLEEGETIAHIALGMYYSTGTVYINAVQLEEGNTANDVNLLSNSSFEINNGVGTIPDAFDNNAGYGAVSSNAKDGQYSFRIDGNAQTTRWVSQTIIHPGKAGDVFSYGAWARADSVPSHSVESNFLVAIRIDYADGSTDWDISSFNSCVGDYQCAFGVAVMKQDYVSIGYSVNYHYNVNTMYIDSVFLYRDIMQSYTYDNNGNIVSTVDYAKQDQSFQYNNNNLAKLIAPTGSSYEYLYDDKNNIKSTRSGEGIAYDITYDSQGNPLTTSLSNYSYSTSIQSGKTYYIRLKGNGQYLTVYNGGTANETNVVHAEFQGAAYQKWKVTSTSDGYYTLTPQHAENLALDVYGAANLQDNNVQVALINGSTAQKFKIIPQRDFSYKLIPQCSPDSKLLTVNHAATSDNVTILSPQGDNNADQEWYFEEVGKVGENTIEDGAVYQFRAFHSGRYLDVLGGYTTAGTYMVQYERHFEGHQKFRLQKYNDTEYYTISPLHAPNILLEVSMDTVTYNGVAFHYLQIGNNPIGDRQLFKMVYNSERQAFQIVSKYNGDTLALDVANNDIFNYARLIFTPLGNGTNRFFIAEKISDTITTSATYQDNGNYLSTTTDERGYTTNYTYDTSRGLQTGITDAKGNTTTYAYNTLNDRLECVTSGNSTVSYQYETDGAIKKITSPSGSVYNFTYDSFGRPIEILIGSQSLSETEYKSNTSSLVSRFEYGNGVYKTYDYDNQDRLISESINNTLSRSYIYDKRGNLVETTDLLGNLITRFHYDLIGRINGITATDGQSMNFVYDAYNRLSLLKWTLGNTALSSSYIYGDTETANQKPGLIYGVKLNGTQQIGYEYDELARLKQRILDTTTPFATEYTYHNGASANTTTTLVKTVKNGNNTLEYAYDEVGNIISVKKNGTIIEAYSYDALNQLVSATYGGNTYTYAYDNGGNIIEVRKNGVVLNTYTYGDADWKDLLTVFNGQTISYDDIGNPLNYRNGMSFTWQNGRQLASISQNGNALASYTYNADGLRTSKTVNGVETEYYWLNGTLYAQKTGDELLYFLYDENGIAYGFIVKNSGGQSYYYYEFNLQGDIIGIVDEAGTRVVEYIYGAWGNILSITGTLADTIGQKNPLRYRGYYYDAETGFYLTGTRYYDPEIGRFLNADGYVSTGQDITGFNMFAYCGNNPVNRIDPTGQFWSSIVSFVKTAISAIGNAIAGKAPVYAGLGTAALADGPAPIVDAIAAIGALAITADAICQGLNQTFQARDASEDKEDAKVIANTKQQKRQVYFPADPYQFTPKGLVMNEYPGTKNGRIIKWSTPITNSVIFEWNEDIKNGAHYHTLMIEWDGKHIGPHYYAGMKVPEPWNSIYFGGQ